MVFLSFKLALPIPEFEIDRFAIALTRSTPAAVFNVAVGQMVKQPVKTIGTLNIQWATYDNAPTVPVIVCADNDIHHALDRSWCQVLGNAKPHLIAFAWSMKQPVKAIGALT